MILKIKMIWQRVNYGKMIKKKAQLKIQQMTFMLVAITLFFILVAMFFLIIRFTELKSTATELEEKNAMLLVSKIANSPEFSCGNVFGGSKINCIDFDKVIVLKQSIEKYQNFWGVSNIEIRRIYPETKGEIICSIQNYPNCNVFRTHSEEITGYELSNFVSLCRKETTGIESYDKCEIAKIMLSYNEK